MHQRGWTNFRIAGQINGQRVAGTGRVPFVYQTSGQYWPWMKLQVGDRQYSDAGGVLLFSGLTRPWLGLHTVDMIRRDAAKQQVVFETRYDAEAQKAEVSMTHEQTTMVYTIDMERDVIEKIVWPGRGEMSFSYLQNVEGVENEFIAPRSSRYTGLQKEAGLIWLFDLVDKN